MLQAIEDIASGLFIQKAVADGSKRTGGSFFRDGLVAGGESDGLEGDGFSLQRKEPHPRPLSTEWRGEIGESERSCFVADGGDHDAVELVGS